MSLTQNFIFGLTLGSYIAIAAVGFTMVYGILNMLNFAHAELMTIGAYVGIVFAQFLEFSLLVTGVMVVGISAAVSWLVARLFFKPISHYGAVPLLLTSVGVGYILRNSLRIVADTDLRFFEYQKPTVYRFDALGGFYINSQQLLLIGVTVLVTVLLHLLLTRTTIGIAMRAMGDVKYLAKVTGIDTDRISSYVWLLAGGLAGLSGLLISTQRAASPVLGFNMFLLVLAAAILGGSGSAYGAIAGSYVLGITISLTAGYLPGWAANLGTTVAYVALICVLLVRPSGIAGGEVEKV